MQSDVVQHKCSQCSTHCNVSRSRPHGVHSTDQSNSSPRNVNMNRWKPFTCSRTTSTRALRQTSSYATIQSCISPVAMRGVGHPGYRMEHCRVHWWDQVLSSCKWWLSAGVMSTRGEMSSRFYSPATIKPNTCWSGMESITQARRWCSWGKCWRMRCTSSTFLKEFWCNR